MKSIQQYVVRFLWILFATNGGALSAQLQADNWMYTYMHYTNFRHASTPDTVSYPFPASYAFVGSGTASYSDKYGNLLFYGVGGTFFDRNFTLFRP